MEVVGLDKFLARVYPKIAEILEKNAKTDILAGYDVIWEDDSNEVTELVHKLTTEYDFAEANNATAKTLQKLKEAEGNTGAAGDDEFDDDFGEYQQDTKKKPEDSKSGEKGDQQYQVTGISWNCNGSSLAVAYGKTDHVSWCEHQSILNVWSLNNTKKPAITIEVPNCLSSITFHPEDPQIVAGGTINGEIFIWNLNDTGKESNQLVSKSEADEYFHREPIKRILWMV